jgi:citrate lyase subunit beta/citryl-CoA lyase
MLFVPGNDPVKLSKAAAYQADSLVLDLENTVPVYEKDAARDLVRNALKYLNYPCCVGVRINHINTPFGWDDLEEIMKVKPAFFRLPKSELEEDVIKVDEFLSRTEKKYGYEEGSVKLVLTMETAKGVINSCDLAAASKRIVAIGIGAEDLAADMQATRSKRGAEILFSRNLIVLAARSAGVEPLDHAYADLSDEEGFYADTQLGKEFGFSGKSVIHPKQVPIVHHIYTPTEVEIVEAQKIIAAYRKSVTNKSGVIALDGKMINTQVVAKAGRTLKSAWAAGKIKDNDN